MTARDGLVTGVALTPRALEDLARKYGGALAGATGIVRRLVPTPRAADGDLTILLHRRYVDEAVRAVERGAALLVDEALAANDAIRALPRWTHAHAAWAMAEILGGEAAADAPEPVVGAGARIGAGAHLLPGVRIGARVTIAPGAVIGAPGFGWVTGPDGRTRAIPQLGGVVIEDDVEIGALCTIASGTIGPTVLRRGVKLDAQVHVGHNCEIGEGTIIAAQSGLAGSVTIGKGVLLGGQVGIADHLRIGDGARIAAKSGVIGDVAPGVTVAGYPAVERQRWLRGLAVLYRSVRLPRGERLR